MQSNTCIYIKKDKVNFYFMFKAEIVYANRNIFYRRHFLSVKIYIYSSIWPCNKRHNIHSASHYTVAE